MKLCRSKAERVRTVPKFFSLLMFVVFSFVTSACSNSDKIAGLLAPVGGLSSAGIPNTGSPIILLPNSPTLSPSTQLLFTATGGKPPYVFSLLIGSGTIDALSGLYVATSNTGTVVVKVTDTLAALLRLRL